MDDASTIAIVGILGTTVAALIWVVKFLFDKLLPRIDEGNKIIEKNNALVHKLEMSTLENTRATKSADSYLRERNGRDNEMHAEMIKAVKEIPAQIIATASITAKVLHDNPVNQRIENQQVEQQIVVEKKTE